MKLSANAQSWDPNSFGIITSQELSAYASIWVPGVGFVDEIPGWYDESTEFKPLDLVNMSKRSKDFDLETRIELYVTEFFELKKRSQQFPNIIKILGYETCEMDCIMHWIETYDNVMEEILQSKL